MAKNYKIKDIKLAGKGMDLIEKAEEDMPVLGMLKEKFKDDRFLTGYKIAGAIHVTKETAVLVRTLRYLGAEVAWSGCNPLSTNDYIAAAMADEGVKIYAWEGNNEKYYWCIDQIIKTKPNLTMDDGCDVVVKLHKENKDYPERKLLENIIGGTEETTTGIHRLKAMENLPDHYPMKLKYPIMAVNDAETKWDFDNIYGTGQGTIHGIQNASATLIAGKNFVVSGYGHCGKGVTKRAQGMGANVIVTEIDPIAALKAVMDGYRVMPMMEAAKIGDIFCTATGCNQVITEEHFKNLKKGAILSNTGHFNVEVDYAWLEENALNKKNIRKYMDRYDLSWGKHVYLLAEGRLVNLAAAEGHPSEVMDLSFANQILCLKQLVKNKGLLDNKVYGVSPEKDKRVVEQDQKIAGMKLKAMGIKIDTLTEEQVKYMNSYDEGT